MTKQLKIIIAVPLICLSSLFFIKDTISYYGRPSKAVMAQSISNLFETDLAEALIKNKLDLENIDSQSRSIVIFEVLCGKRDFNLEPKMGIKLSNPKETYHNLVTFDGKIYFKPIIHPENFSLNQNGYLTGQYFENEFGLEYQVVMPDKEGLVLLTKPDGTTVKFDTGKNSSYLRVYSYDNDDNILSSSGVFPSPTEN